MTAPVVRDISPAERIDQLLAKFGSSDASVAWLLCDSYPEDRPAYTLVEPDLTTAQLTYGELRRESEKCAAALADLGIRPGDRVATLMGKTKDYLVSILGIWRLGAVHVPLFTAFAPPAIAQRLADSQAKVVICDDDQLTKLLPDKDIPGTPRWRVIVARSEETPLGATDSAEGSPLVLTQLVAAQEAGFPAAILGGDAPVIHIFTSGTTGHPKGVVVPTRALAGFQLYAELALDLRADDTYWCAADPGWAYGLYFGIIGSLATGVHSVLLHAGFTTDLTWAVLEREQVTNFAAAPTVYRALRATSGPGRERLALRCASSAGEPLTPEVNEWASEALGVQVYDHYGQTEAGMLINNHHRADLATPIRTGSMGRAMPGWAMCVLLPDNDVVAAPGTVGRLAADLSASPLAWFSGYDGDPARSSEKFTADRRWYLTGDIAHVDDTGSFYYSARDDDVIIMAGYRIGPFEVESVLVTDSRVREAAVIAVPDELRGEVIEAYVVLADGIEPAPELAASLQQLVKTQLAAHAYPRRIHFTDQLPKTPSGKIQRFVLRQRRRDEGDCPSHG
jgi:acetyl-CoA synthetase